MCDIRRLCDYVDDVPICDNEEWSLQGSVIGSYVTIVLALLGGWFEFHAASRL